MCFDEELNKKTHSGERNQVETFEAGPGHNETRASRGEDENKGRRQQERMRGVDGPVLEGKNRPLSGSKKESSRPRFADEPVARRDRTRVNNQVSLVRCTSADDTKSNGIAHGL